MGEKETIYKVKYVIEIKVNEQDCIGGSGREIEPEVDVKREESIRNFDPNNYQKLFDFTEKHFPSEIKELFSNILIDEGILIK
jgi:hypothetical protein